MKKTRTAKIVRTPSRVTGGLTDDERRQREYTPEGFQQVAD